MAQSEVRKEVFMIKKSVKEMVNEGLILSLSGAAEYKNGKEIILESIKKWREDTTVITIEFAESSDCGWIREYNNNDLTMLIKYELETRTIEDYRFYKGRVFSSFKTRDDLELGYTGFYQTYSQDGKPAYVEYFENEVVVYRAHYHPFKWFGRVLNC
jgi:hypothetical protein